MGSLGIFIKTVIAFANFLRENRSYRNTIPRSVLFWCAIASLMNNVYQYNAVVLAEKELDNKNKLILNLQNNKVITVDDVVIKKLDDLNNKIDSDTKCQLPTTEKHVSEERMSLTRYQQLKQREHK